MDPGSGEKETGLPSFAHFVGGWSGATEGNRRLYIKNGGKASVTSD
jgi:hypothetical protein